MRCITACMQRWQGESAGQKSARTGLILFFATLYALSTSSDMPSPLIALIGTHGIPNSLLSLSMSIVPPLARTSSIIFRARTMGTSSSSNCIVRYKFRSILVASTMLMIQSGRSSNMYLVVTISSCVYGRSEYIPGKSTTEP